MKKKSKFYYGWIVTLLAGLTYFGSNGLLSASAGTIVSEVLLVRGWDAAQVSLTYTIKSFIGLLLPLVGMALAKIGPRKCIFWTTIVTAVCLAATGWVETPVMFIIVYGIAVSFSMLFNDQLACFAAVNNWWDRRRGEQSGYVNALGGAGGVLFPPIITWLFLNYSWKTCLIIMAIALVLITALPQMIWMKDHPSEMGLEIDGGAADERPAKNGKAHKTYEGYRSPINWEAKDALRTPQLWIAALAWSSIVLGYCALMYYGMTHMMMNGVAAMTASYAVSVQQAVTILASIFLGRLVDRFNPKYMMVFIALINVVGCILFDRGTISGGLAVAFIGSGLMGLANGPMMSTLINLLCSYFGAKNFPKIQPYCNIVVTLVGAGSSLVCGWALTNFGSLSNAYFVAAGMSLLMGIIVVLFMKPPKVSAAMLAKYGVDAASGTKD